MKTIWWIIILFVLYELLTKQSSTSVSGTSSNPASGLSGLFAGLQNLFRSPSTTAASTTISSGLPGAKPVTTPMRGLIRVPTPTRTVASTSRSRFVALT